MDTDRFIMHIKTKDFYKDISNDVEKGLIHQIMKSVDQKSDWINEGLTRKKDYDRICCFKTKNLFILNR